MTCSLLELAKVATRVPTELGVDIISCNDDTMTSINEEFPCARPDGNYMFQSGLE